MTMTALATQPDTEIIMGGESSLSPIEQQQRAETDVQIATAKRYPRSIRTFMDHCMDMATLNEAVAESCFYVLPRGGKKIDGPSARLAEIIVSAWGNCDAGARVIGEDAQFVTAQGVFRDLERNTRITFEVRRRITDKNGRRFNDDMIAVTSNAACSIALRNAVFKGVPKAYWEPIYHEARRASVGDTQTLQSRRTNMMDYFVQKMGVDEQKVYDAVGVKGFEDIGVDELIQLKGMATAIKEGDASVDSIFNPQPPSTKSDTKKVDDAISNAVAEQNGRPPETSEQEAPSNEPPPADDPRVSDYQYLVNCLMEKTGCDPEPARNALDRKLQAEGWDADALTPEQVADLEKAIKAGRFDKKV